ncbi:phosphonate ABC transporter, permease protein PhnE [Gracilibacillus suaedae]|uniref:phosphonate ABC transporter, permease protein PhnE n=1 Tax=Gracilibacillus suaedae TaxID=2820273 RepID=UPI001ABE31A8|nr:phosphonate ABC transporter, permease protein PhnE [Gracilibacillus suaedae]
MSEKQLLQVRKQKRLQVFLFFAAMLALSVWSAISTGFSFSGLFTGTVDSTKFIIFDLFPPDFSYIASLVEPALETIYMSFVAMVIGAIVAAFLAIFASATTAPHPIVQVAVRAFSSLFRNIPVLIWTILLAAAYGLGTLVGTIALIMVSTGALTRAFAEILEEIDMGQVEAVRATGASYGQVLAQGVLPQFLPGFFGWSLYMLEINIRASTIIGMVGGGGLGFVIQTQIKLFQYEQVSMAVLLTLVLVLIMEWITNQIRERII